MNLRFLLQIKIKGRHALDSFWRTKDQSPKEVSLWKIMGTYIYYNAVATIMWTHMYICTIKRIKSEETGFTVSTNISDNIHEMCHEIDSIYKSIDSFHKALSAAVNRQTLHIRWSKIFYRSLTRLDILPFFRIYWRGDESRWSWLYGALTWVNYCCTSYV